MIGRGRDSLAAHIPTNVLDRDLEPADAVIETWVWGRGLTTWLLATTLRTLVRT